LRSCLLYADSHELGSWRVQLDEKQVDVVGVNSLVLADYFQIGKLHQYLFKDCAFYQSLKALYNNVILSNCESNLLDTT
jgi:hypothetical protein